MLKPSIVSSTIHHVKKEASKSLLATTKSHKYIHVQSKFDRSQKFPQNKNVLKSSRISKHIELRFRDLSPPGATPAADLSGAMNHTIELGGAEPSVTGVGLCHSPSKYIS